MHDVDSIIAVACLLYFNAFVLSCMHVPEYGCSYGVVRMF